MRQFPVIPDPNKILIVDISKWQDAPDTPLGVDFGVMKSKNVSGVIMKVGQGAYVDRAWEPATHSALIEKMPIGGYWYYDNRIEPKKQARIMAEAVGEYPLPLGLWLDLEDKQEGAYKGWKNWYTFLEKLKELLPGKKYGIYTGYYYWMERTVMSQIPPASLNYFKQYPLWIASYNVVPRIPAPWSPNYLIWQFTDLLDGKYYGAESVELDGDYFNGTLEEYKNYFKLGDSIPPIILPPTENPMVATYNCVARFKVKVRPDPSTANATDNYFLAGDNFQISEIVPDRLDPTNTLKLWGHVFGGVHDGQYTALLYPGNESPISTYTPITNTPPSTEVILTHTIEVYSDGSIKIDGNSF